MKTQKKRIKNLVGAGFRERRALWGLHRRLMAEVGKHRKRSAALYRTGGFSGINKAGIEGGGDEDWNASFEEAGQAVGFADAAHALEQVLKKYEIKPIPKPGKGKK